MVIEIFSMPALALESEQELCLTAAFFTAGLVRQPRADTWESTAAGPAIAKRAQEKLSEKRPSVLLEMAGGDIRKVSGEFVGRAHAMGDKVAKEVMQETVELLAYWLGNIIDLLEPDVIVVGGGVCTLVAPFFDDIRERWRGACINPSPADTPLILAHYREDAGIAGAAALCEFD